MKHRRRSLLMLCAFALLAACTSERGPDYLEPSHKNVFRRALEAGFEHKELIRVRPWERDLLARREMAWEPDRLHAARDAHIHFSKEASLAGGSSGGGGCGCN